MNEGHFWNFLKKTKRINRLSRIFLNKYVTLCVLVAYKELCLHTFKANVNLFFNTITH